MTKEYIENTFFTKNGNINPYTLKKESLTQEKLYLIYHNLEIAPKCICGKTKKFNSFKKGFTVSCGNNSCGTKISLNKRKETNLKKYGVEEFTSSTLFISKRKETMLTLYGAEYSLQSKEITKKIKSTKKEKYGNENYNNHDKMVITQNLKYGSVFNHEKSKTTKKEKYGNENYNNRKKAKLTCIQKYRVSHTQQLDETKIKQKNTRINNGTQIPDDKLSDWEYYKKTVWHFTNKQDISKLENSSLRGRKDLNPNAHQLDHKISIKYGFENNIPIYLISSIDNLQMLLHSENASKGAKCYSKLKLIKEL